MVYGSSILARPIPQQEVNGPSAYYLLFVNTNSDDSTPDCMSRNSEPLKIIGLSFIILAVFSLISPELQVKLGLKKPFDLFSDFRKLTTESKPVASKKNDSLPATKPASIPHFVDFSSKETDQSLEQFFKKLQALKKGKRKKVRIGYFGDSMIEGDLITQNIRQILQSTYGGHGVGFVPITSVVAGFRQTVQHTFSQNWIDQNFQNAKKIPFHFLSGHQFKANESAWVEYGAVKQKQLNTLPNPTLLCAKNEQAILIQMNAEELSLNPNKAFNAFRLSENDKLNKIKLNFPQGASGIYGICFESDSGLVLDNFSFRGSSGLELNCMKSDAMAELFNARPYDLLILHYGPNLLFKPLNTDFSYYKKQLKKTLTHLKKNSPGCAILLISSADKSYRSKEGKWITAPGVEPLIAVQKELAEELGFGFINLYELMGGNGTMTKWVEQKPVLAYKDYTHFNNSGAAYIGKLLAKKLQQNNHEQKPN